MCNTDIYTYSSLHVFSYEMTVKYNNIITIPDHIIERCFHTNVVFQTMHLLNEDITTVAVLSLTH